MSETTTLDAAHAGMQAGQAGRMRFYQRLADAELFVLLSHEAQGEKISPELFEVADGRFVLVFDREERLARFVGAPAPYAALSGRVLAQMLGGQDIGLGLNLEVAPSSMLIPPRALEWLHQTLEQTPDRITARIAGISAPTGASGELMDALHAKLATSGGLVRAAYLVWVTYVDGTQGHLVGFVDADPRAQDALAKAVGEAWVFCGELSGALDVGFFVGSDPEVAQLAAHGIGIDLPRPEMPETHPTAPPGSDPDNPPILR